MPKDYTAADCYNYSPAGEWLWGQKKSLYFVFSPQTMLLRDPFFHPSRPHKGLHMATVALGLDDFTAFPLFPTMSAPVILLDCDNQIKLLLAKLYLNLEGCVFQLKTDLEANKKLP